MTKDVVIRLVVDSKSGQASVDNLSKKLKGLEGSAVAGGTAMAGGTGAATVSMLLLAGAVSKTASSTIALGKATKKLKIPKNLDKFYDSFNNKINKATKSIEKQTKAIGKQSTVTKKAIWADTKALYKQLKPIKNTRQELFAMRSYWLAITAAIAIATVSVGKFFSVGFKAVENFKLSVASIAATVTTFSANTGESLSRTYRKAYEYSEALVYKMEEWNAKTVATGANLSAMVETMAQGGVFLDLNNKKQEKGFLAIANALALITQGQNQEIQFRQEIRGLILGEVRATNLLARLIEKRLGGSLKKQIELWKKQGTLIENVGGLLTGFSAATVDLESTWMAVGTTLKTIATRVLRGAFLPVYKDIIKISKKITLGLLDQSEETKKLIKQLKNGVWTTWVKIKEEIRAIPKYIDAIKASLSTIWDVVSYDPLVIKVFFAGLLLWSRKVGIMFAAIVFAFKDLYKRFKYFIAMLKGDIPFFTWFFGTLGDYEKIMEKLEKRTPLQLKADSLIKEINKLKKLTAEGKIFYFNLEENKKKLVILQKELEKVRSKLKEIRKEAKPKIDLGGFEFSGFQRIEGHWIKIKDAITESKNQYEEMNNLLNKSEMDKALEFDTPDKYLWSAIEPYVQTDKMKKRYTKYLADLKAQAENAEDEEDARELERLIELRPYVAARLALKESEQRDAHKIFLKDYNAKEAATDEYNNYRTSQELSIASQIKAIRMEDKAFALADLEERYESAKNFTDDRVGLEKWYVSEKKRIQGEGTKTWKDSLRSWVKSTKTWQEDMVDIGIDAAHRFSSGFTDAFFEFAEGTKSAGEAFRSFAADFLKQTAKMIMQLVIFRAIQAICGIYSGGGGTTTVEGTGTNTAAQQGVPNVITTWGKGGAFSNGMVQAFAGGGVVNRSTVFPMKRGYGLMGEDGPEAILPLQRGRGGKLGVAGGGSTVNTTINVNTTPAGDPEEAKRQAREMSRVIESEFNKNLMKQMRSGGALDFSG